MLRNLFRWENPWRRKPWWGEKQYFQSPSCVNAEHLFIAFMLYLTENQNSVLQYYLKNTEIWNRDQNKSTTALVLFKPKTHPEEEPNFLKRHSFGANTNIALTGPYAGVINELEYGSQKHTAKRVIVEHPLIVPNLEAEIEYWARFAKYEKIRHRCELFVRTKDVIIEAGGGIQALFYLLDQLKVDFERETFMKNTQLHEKSIKPTHEKSFQI